MNRDFSIVEQRIGYRFKDRQLLDTALTHASYANEHNVMSNERLEFLGDSILNFLVAEKLYHEGMNEGEMTKRRAKIVSRLPLALAVENLAIMEFLLLGTGAENEEKLSVKFKSNLFEAIIGAVYLDGGCDLQPCKNFIFSHLSTVTENFIDYKSKLQEFVQAKKIGAIEYKDTQISKGRTPVFFAEVFVDGKKLGEGHGGKKQEAQKNAAKQALEVLLPNCKKID